jgi:hypothetical protein
LLGPLLSLLFGRFGGLGSGSRGSVNKSASAASLELSSEERSNTLGTTVVAWFLFVKQRYGLGMQLLFDI